jgi:hypothetical protein
LLQSWGSKVGRPSLTKGEQRTGFRFPENSLRWTIFTENLLICIPVALLVASIAGFRGLRRDFASTRGRRTLIGVMLLLAAVVAWPVAALFDPSVPSWSNPSYLAACQHAHRYLQVWRGIGIFFCFSGWSISAFGNPRKLSPISIAAVGLGLLWLIGTAPIPQNCAVIR